MRTTVSWCEVAQFSAKSGSGHTVLMDGPPAYGGENAGPRPMEMILMGLAGCAAFDVVHILRKSRQELSKCLVQVEAERADAVPSVFTKIHLHFCLAGPDLKESQVVRAIKLSAEKYCSASIMLAQAGVTITHSHTLENNGEEDSDQ